MPSSGRPCSRLLICAAELAGAIGGLQHVLADLAEGLRGRGWHVDIRTGAAIDETSPGFALFGLRAWQFRLIEASRPLHIPEACRLNARVLLQGRTRLRHLSAALRDIQLTIESGRYDVVLACLNASPVGFGSLVARSHPCAVLMSLDAIAFELRNSKALGLARGTAHLVTRGEVHPDLYSAVQPSRVRAVVFASRSWRDGAVAAGLPAARSRVIHFGIESPPSLEDLRPPGSPVRLLWAGRLAVDKGLHWFLPALALLRRDFPLRLTILAAPGPDPYRFRIERLIRRLQIGDFVDLQPAVSRAKLPGVFVAHDALLFYSMFPEPVAQVLLLAFAHGLIVVGPSSKDPRSLLQPAETAFCFANCSAAEIAAAIRRAVGDTATRLAVRARAFERVRTEHTLAQTIAEYDSLLSEVVDVPRGGRPI